MYFKIQRALSFPSITHDNSYINIMKTCITSLTVMHTASIFTREGLIHVNIIHLGWGEIRAGTHTSTIISINQSLSVQAWHKIVINKCAYIYVCTILLDYVVILSIFVQVWLKKNRPLVWLTYLYIFIHTNNITTQINVWYTWKMHKQLVLQLIVVMSFQLRIE